LFVSADSPAKDALIPCSTRSALIANHYHDLPKEAVLSLPNLIQDPKLILNSNRNNLGTLALLDGTDKEGRPLVLPTSPYGIVSNQIFNTRLPAMIVLSCYGAESAGRLLTTEAIRQNALYIK
jgi:hypothetical protein